MATIKIFKHHMRVPFLILLLVDCSVLFFSSYIGIFLRFDEVSWHYSTGGSASLPIQAAVMAFVLLLGLIAMGQYQAQQPASRSSLVNISFRVFISIALGTLGLMVLYYLLPSLYLGRGVMAYSLGAAIVLLTFVRLFYFSFVDSSALRRRVLIYGAGEAAAGLLGVRGDPKESLVPMNRSYVICGFVPIEGEEVSVPQEFCVNAKGAGLLAYCLANDIDEVVIAIKDRRQKLPVNDLLDCKLKNIDVIDFISFQERENGMLFLEFLQPSWMIFGDGYAAGGVKEFADRLFDIVFSLIILVATAPLTLLTAIAIFLESGFRGPIFYRQTRVGLNNQNFDLLKFRSMTVDAEKDGKAVWASQNDARVTFVGRFIRKTRIDEIPQLINVLRGDMSVVGPRPERPEFVEKLEKVIPYYRLRHRVKPGLAGWAQIRYPYGANEKDAYNKLQFDLFYIKNRTLFFDLLVLLQTTEVVIMGKGAR